MTAVVHEWAWNRSGQNYRNWLHVRAALGPALTPSS
jgi:uncharacterized membrane protein YbaN (DUF454 family)